MRISDWSSDVCSSDLIGRDIAALDDGLVDVRQNTLHGFIIHAAAGHVGRELVLLVHLVERGGQIGRASCRERVCQYVKITVVAVSLKKKNQRLISNDKNKRKHIIQTQGLKVQN